LPKCNNVCAFETTIFEDHISYLSQWSSLPKQHLGVHIYTCVCVQTLGGITNLVKYCSNQQ